jgi:hypothetical protein
MLTAKREVKKKGLWSSLTLYTSHQLGYRLSMSNTAIFSGGQHLLMLCTV